MKTRYQQLLYHYENQNITEIENVLEEKNQVQKFDIYEPFLANLG